MRKLFLIGFGLMASCLSAMALPDHTTVIHDNNFEFKAQETLFAPEVFTIQDYAVADFVFEIKSPVVLQTFVYVSSVNVVDLTLFYRPIIYENYNAINPLTSYDTYRGNGKIKIEKVINNPFLIKKIPRLSNKEQFLVFS